MLRSRRAWATTPALVAAAFLTSTPAGADTSSDTEVEVVSVSYAAEESCPSRERFIQNVRRYTTKWRVADSSSSVRTFRIVLDTRGKEHHGTVSIETPDGRATRREIVAPDCERVARGLAVAMALAIDPEAKIGETQDVPEPPVAGAPEDGETPPPSPPPPRPPPPPSGEAKSSVVAPRRRPRLVAFVVEGRVELTSLVAASAVPVIGAAFEARLNPPGAPAWLSPSLAIGARQSWPTVVQAPSGGSEFLWTAATFRLCPVRVRLAANRFDAAPCAEANAGVLRAEARAVQDARAASSGWFDMGGSVRGVYRIGASWGLGGAVLVSAPFVRHRFAFTGGEVVSQAPAIGITGSLLVELRL